MEREELIAYLRSLPDQISTIDVPRAKREFWYFVRSYLAHHIEYSQKESSLFRSFIYKNIDKLTKRHRFLLFSAYRGAAKTTLLSTFYPLWEIVRQKRRFVVLIGATQPLANAILELIIIELTENRALQRDFGITILSQKTESITLKVGEHNCKIAAFGAGAKIRGIKYLSFRPDLIIVDDLEEDELVLNKNYRDKQERWFKKAVMKLPSRKGKANIIMVGTILHHDSVFVRLQKIADLYRNFPLVLDFSSWKLDDPSLDLKSLQKEFQEDKEAFLQEYQNVPLSKDALTFSHYKTYEAMPQCDFYAIGIDPAMGKRKGDYFAIAVLGYEKKNKRFYLTATGYKKSPTQMIATIISWYLRYAKKAQTVLAIETVAYQEFFKDVLGRAALQSGVSIPIKPIKNSAPKELRINALAPLVKDEIILIDAKAQLLIEELDTYPKAAHDDLLDAAEMAKRVFDIGGGVDYALVRRHARQITKRLKFAF